MDFSNLFRSLRDFVKPDPISEQVARSGVKGMLVREGYNFLAFDDRGPRRTHEISDLPSLLAYLRRHGTPAKTTLFCGTNGFVAILDDVGEPDLNRIKSPLALTTSAQLWKAAVSRKFSHVDFKEFVEDRKTDIVDFQSFLAPLLKFKLRSELAYSADLEDGKSVTFTVSEGQEKGTAKVDKEIEVEIPLFLGWDRHYRFSVRVDFDLVDAGEGKKKVVFSVAFRDWAEVYEQALEDLLAYAREELGSDWLVVRGVPSAEAPPTLPGRLAVSK